MTRCLKTIYFTSVEHCTVFFIFMVAWLWDFKVGSDFRLDHIILFHKLSHTTNAVLDKNGYSYNFNMQIFKVSFFFIAGVVDTCLF